MSEMITQTIVTAVAAILVAGLSFCAAKIRSMAKKQAAAMAKQSAEQEAIREGLKALLRDRVVQMYNYYIIKGRMPIYARENTQSLQTQYKALNGNGVIDGLVQKLMLLPTDASSVESRDVID